MKSQTRNSPMLKFRTRAALPAVLLLAAVCLPDGALPTANAAEEILPIQFADQIDGPPAGETPFQIPSVITEDVAGPRAAPGEIILRDEPLAVRDQRLNPGEKPRPRGEESLEVSEESLVDVSSKAADGLRIDDFSLDEMPFEASSGDWFSTGNMYGSAEVLFFSRSRNFRRVLGYDVSYTPRRKNPVGTFTTTGIPFDLAPGARVTLGKYLGRDDIDRDRSLEMTYYGGFAYGQQDTWNALPGSTLVTPLGINVPGFDLAQRFSTIHNSNFNSMEWNYKLHRRLGRDQLVMSPNGEWERHAERAWLPSLIIGTRVATVSEYFMFTSRRTNVNFSEFGGDYQIGTQNWLWGMNFGGELISQNEFYYWGLRGRGTPAMNFAANQQSLIGNDQTALLPPRSVNRASSASEVAPGFVGDLSLFAGWNVTPNFSLKAGYDFLWVAGIATATRQFDLNNVRENPIDAGGQIFYNGLSIGCEGSW